MVAERGRSRNVQPEQDKLFAMNLKDNKSNKKDRRYGQRQLSDDKQQQASSSSKQADRNNKNIGRKPKEEWLKSVECNFCHEEGHMWKNCPKIREQMESKASKQSQQKPDENSTNKKDTELWMMSGCHPMTPTGRWLADSAAGCHIT